MPELTLQSRTIALRFDPMSGALLELVHRPSRANWLSGDTREGNLFRVYVDPQEVPLPFRDPDDWGGQVDDDFGGAIVDAREFSLATARGGVFTLRHAPTRLTATLRVRLVDERIALNLSVRNDGSAPRRLMVAFPHLSGVRLGGSELGLMQASFGTPGVPAWKPAGGAYGRNVATAWDAVYAPDAGVALGLLALDPKLAPKLIRRGPGGVMSALHLAQPVAPGASLELPPAELMAVNGTWRPIARRYGDWLRSNFPPRRSPSWLADIDLYTGPWIPHPDAVAQAQRAGAGFRSYADLPLLYADDPYDLKEWAQYNDGVRTNPKTYGAYMADGVYRLRTDLGGEAAARKGIAALHAMGRRAIFYVAGNSVLRDSPLFAGGRIDDWLLMDRPGHSHDIGYPNGVSVCPGYRPWQEHLASVCARLLRETGADGVRLDELATAVPCFNPAHRHASPYDGVLWLRELARTVRAAMDAVNPDTLLLTEGPLDALHEFCDGALQMFGPGRDLDTMRVALPSYRIFSYHPGAVEAARDGLIPGRTAGRRTTFPWEHRGVPGRPADYAEGPGPELRWHELRATFAEAIDRGTVADRDPKAPFDPRWCGRLFVGKRFCLLVGGAEDGQPLPGPIAVDIDGLPRRFHKPVCFDLATGGVTTPTLQDNLAGAARLTLPGTVCAVLIAADDCPPLPDLQLPATIARGTTVTVPVRWAMAGQWRSAASAKVRTGGLNAPATVRTPGSFTLTAPADAAPGLHWVRLEGDVLPVKRWIRVV